MPPLSPLEIAAAIAVFVLAWRQTRPWRFPGWRALTAWSCDHGRSMACLTVAGAGVLGLLTSAALTAVHGIPVPGCHDEFSYLLAGDTFAEGRVTNPTHPFWRHFESIHVIQQPTYMSKYPPGQGAVLAVGRLLANQPIVGVWLSIGLASAAVGWMLLAWLPPRWALLGGLCATLRLSAGPWSDSYWGGAVAVAGGGLLFGSVRRLADRPDWRTASLLALGLGILANSRPFEGLVAALACAVFLVIAWRRRGLLCQWSTWLSTACPLVLVLLMLGCELGLYDRAITGNAWRLPYQTHDAIYAGCPTFLWQAARPAPAYRHADMEQYYAHWERDRFLKKRQWGGFNSSYLTKLWVFGRFFIGPALLVPFVAAALSARGFWLVAAWGVLDLSLLAMSQTLYLHPHYLAHLLCLVWFLVIQGARTLALWRIGQRRRPWIACALLVVAALSPVVSGIMASPYVSRRSAIESRIAQHAGRHLILVQFASDADIHESWIDNRADIDGSNVVWARSLGRDADARLVQYFADRHVWRLLVSAGNTELRPLDRDELPGTNTELVGRARKPGQPTTRPQAN